MNFVTGYSELMLEGALTLFDPRRSFAAHA